MMSDRHLSPPDLRYQQAKSATRPGCHYSFCSMTIKSKPAAHDWNQLAVYSSDTHGCAMSAGERRVRCEFRVNVSLPCPPWSQPLFTPLTCWFCMGAGGNTIQYVNVTLEPSRLSAGPSFGMRQRVRKRDSWLPACISAPFYFTACQIYLQTANFMFCFMTGRPVEGDSAWEQITRIFVVVSSAQWGTNDCRNNWQVWWFIFNFNVTF